MKVNFYATLRQITGQKTVEFTLTDGITVQQLLDAVLARYPEMRDDLLDENGRLYGHVHLFINGRDAPYLDDGLTTVLKPTDKVDLFPAVGGG
ncbi:MAG: ubiquitin-like small modifier protein 1 [Chloroflexota bacterium]